VSLPPFAVTFDYRCPFARTVHEHLVLALQAGADFNVSFLPFSLDQPHVEPGGLDAWHDPARVPSQTATLVGLAVRDTQPEHFLAVHLALFTARHERQLNVKDEAAVARVVDEAGGDGQGAGERARHTRAHHTGGARGESDAVRRAQRGADRREQRGL